MYEFNGQQKQKQKQKQKTMKQAELAIPSKTSKALNSLNDRNHFIFINFFTIAGSILLCAFGIKNIFEQKYILSAAIFSTAILGWVNLIYFFFHRNYQFAAALIGYVIIVFCGFLVLSGGHNQTGPLWVYPLIAVTVFLNKVKHGIILSAVFLIFCIGLIFNSSGELVNGLYTLDASIRFVVSLCALLIFCIGLGYIQEQSEAKLQTLQLGLERAANVDFLTQLYNRHFMINNFLQNNHFAVEGCQKSSILLIDIDNFKSINDDYGHQAGDVALQEIALRLRKGVRKGDVICRWGGEEFLVILKDTPLETAYQRAETFRQLIEHNKFTYNQFDYQLTISVGVSEVNQQDTASEIINMADENLYKAKRQGKNKVC